MSAARWPQKSTLGITHSAIRNAFAALALIAASCGTAVAACAADKVAIKGDFGQIEFTVEIAATSPDRAQGLMNRASMPRIAGMLFVYERPQRLAFWMRNTLIPLDMLFVENSGRIAKIHANAIPLDETPIEGGQGLTHVLEINGGLAARFGIKEGDIMRHPSFPSDAALWPCAAS